MADGIWRVRSVAKRRSTRWPGETKMGRWPFGVGRMAAPVGRPLRITQGHFLRMPDQKNLLLRKTIIDRIGRKNPRLSVVITDSCNTLAPGAVFVPGFPCAILRATISPLFDELFLKTEGLVDINSSSENQIAAGPTGGGLMVLSMAYNGGTPDFQKIILKGIDLMPTTGATSPRGSTHCSAGLMTRACLSSPCRAMADRSMIY